MFGNTIFINYRRADSAPFALALKLELLKRIEAVQVFLDVQRLKAGDRWPAEIENALKGSKCVLALIGPKWLGTGEATRRIDEPDDWVRREIEYSLVEKPGTLIPILLEGAPPPAESELPASIRGLNHVQGLPLRSTSWNADLDALTKALGERYGLKTKSAVLDYPKPDPMKVETIAIPWEKLESELPQYLPKWRIEFSDHPEKLDYVKIEIARDYRFKSFDAAIRFIDEAAKHAEEVEHHPTLTNLWRTVTVRLSTWDAGHRVTALDLQFARVLDRKFAAIDKATDRDRD